MKNIKIFLITFVIFIAIDIVWIGFVAQDFYYTNLASIIAPTFKLLPAFIFYLIYILAIVHFVIKPGLQKRSISSLLLNGALLGLTCYATYDLTNYATLNDFPLKVVLVDLVWGTTLTTLISYFSYLICNKVKI